MFMGLDLAQLRRMPEVGFYFRQGQATTGRVNRAASWVRMGWTFRGCSTRLPT
jgi:hypothetical protein